MENDRQTVRPDDRIDLAPYSTAFRRVWWKAVLLSLGTGILVLVLMFWMPDLFSATAVIKPASDEGKTTVAQGALSSFGIVVEGPSRVEDLETLFRSNDLTARVFRKYNLWPIVFPDRYDPKTGKMKTHWMDGLLGRGKGPKAPGDWDAMRAAQSYLAVSVNRKLGTVTVSFESPSPEGAAKIVGYYLEEGKSRLQEEAFDRATSNKKFIQVQIGRTSDPVTRDRLYALYGQEVEREMLARNREQFGFKLVDSPWVPERKSRPHRAKSALQAMVLSFPLWAVLLGLRKRKAAPPTNAP